MYQKKKRPSRPFGEFVIEFLCVLRVLIDWMSSSALKTAFSGIIPGLWVDNGTIKVIKWPLYCAPLTQSAQILMWHRTLGPRFATISCFYGSAALVLKARALLGGEWNEWKRINVAFSLLIWPFPLQSLPPRPLVPPIVASVDYEIDIFEIFSLKIISIQIELTMQSSSETSALPFAFAHAQSLRHMVLYNEMKRF